MTELFFLLVSTLAGTVGGLLGMGASLILIPFLIYIQGWPETTAQGTLLAMALPPVGFLAFWQYYKCGSVRLAAAVLVALAFITGAHLGARLAEVLPAKDLSRIFGLFALVVAARMILARHQASDEQDARCLGPAAEAGREINDRSRQ